MAVDLGPLALQQLRAEVEEEINRRARHDQPLEPALALLDLIDRRLERADTLPTVAQRQAIYADHGEKRYASRVTVREAALRAALVIGAQQRLTAPLGLQIGRGRFVAAACA